MPYDFTATKCASCVFGHCFEDRRSNPVKGRNTEFRVLQTAAIQCTFDAFVPGSDNDPYPENTFNHYLSRFRENILQAGKHLHGTDFSVNSAAFAKVEGDVAEILEAAVLWNVAARWNNFMSSGTWSSQTLHISPLVTPDTNHRVAIVKLPRKYDATRLFAIDARTKITALESKLKSEGMELGLSAPDIVGVLLPPNVSLQGSSTTQIPLFDNKDGASSEDIFSVPMIDLGSKNLYLIENAHKILEGKILQNGLLFAIAVKRTIRSDRLYQPLFEANVLKYLIHGLLGAKHFKFHAHVWDTDGANVEGHYKAASLYSLIKDASLPPERAVDRLLTIIDPLAVAQAVLDDVAQIITSLSKA